MEAICQLKSYISVKEKGQEIGNLKCEPAEGNLERRNRVHSEAFERCFLKSVLVLRITCVKNETMKLR